ncbi:hypothetical protein GJ496_004966 [Pomphorhynchus laevis]|nr:hypothetical protein GJ496_004966 [Pomphorhynchus laevis]
MMWKRSRIIPGRIQRINGDYSLDDIFCEQKVEQITDTSMDSASDSFEKYDSSVSQDWTISKDKKDKSTDLAANQNILEPDIACL